MVPGVDTSTVDQSITRRSIKARVEHYVVVMNVLGHVTDAARARATNLGADAVRRAVAGSYVGEIFVAHTLAFLTQHRGRLSRYGLGVDFADVFEIVEVEAATQ